MGIYNDILVAFDGSKPSENALKQIIKVSKQENSKVAAVTVMRKVDLEPVVINGRRDSHNGLVGDSNANTVKIVLEEDGSEVQTILEEGVVHEAIIDAARSKDCDLIIMGRRPISGLERAFAGSFTAKTIRYSPIDVLVMPSDGKLGWKNILLATDGSECSAAAAERALEIAQTHGGELKVVTAVDTAGDVFLESPGLIDNVMNKSKESLDSISKKGEEIGVKVEQFIVEGEPHVEIVNLARKLKSDVICMGSHGRTGLSRLLMGSVTEKVLEQAPCSVLVIKPKDFHLKNNKG